MALIKCQECKNKISSKAESCPQCGCPVKKRKNNIGWGTSCLAIIIAIVIIFIVYFLVGIYSVDDGSTRLSSSSRGLSHGDPNRVASSRREPLYGDSNNSSLSSIKYTIIKSETTPGIIRFLDVRLEEKISESQLKELAYKLKNLDPSHYKVGTRIFYLLPGMEPGCGAWATTHFNPDLKVSILGMTKEQERELLEKTKTINVPSQQILGQWLHERGPLSYKVIIYKGEGKFFIVKIFSDGSSGTDELIEIQPSPVGRRFREDEESYYGDHYIIDKNGDLQIWDNQGHIRTAYKIAD